jgi:hypothetical protein
MPTIGGASDGKGGMPKTAPSCSPSPYQKAMATSDQTTKEMKKSFGFGKKDRNKCGTLVSVETNNSPPEAPKLGQSAVVNNRVM